MKKNLFQLAAVVFVACGWLWFRSSFSEPENNRNESIIDADYQRGRQAVKQGEFGPAIRRLTNVIEAEPDHCHAYFQRGMAHLALGHNEDALKDFTRDIELQPGRAASSNNRSVLWKSKGELERSLADSDEAISLAPANVPFRHNLADTCFKTGEIQKGLVDLYVALELAPDNPYTHHYLAWFYATCPDDRYRDPKSAIEHAIHSCENSEWRVGFMISVLAISHASDGQFSEAVVYEVQARELYSPEEMKMWGDRLQLFQDGKTLIDNTIRVRKDDPGPMNLEVPVIPGGLRV